jgi:hypothetical protein
MSSFRELATSVRACFRLSLSERRFLLGVLFLFAFGLAMRLYFRSTAVSRPVPPPPPPLEESTP